MFRDGEKSDMQSRRQEGVEETYGIAQCRGHHGVVDRELSLRSLCEELGGELYMKSRNKLYYGACVGGGQLRRVADRLHRP